jgi:hypothetical protein
MGIENIRTPCSHSRRPFLGIGIGTALGLSSYVR